MSKIAVALSGGVDSAVVAALLLEQGHEVVGITGKMTCTADSEQVVINAKKVANKLNIEHFAVDVTSEFNEKVIKYFEDSYKNGLTPNPCIMCNKYIKWGTLFDFAIKKLNCNYIATGHYAKIKEIEGFYKLYPASDEHKDQLYFLFSLNQEQLSKTLFPLSEYKKSEVKILAEKYDLPPKSAKESQDICFIKAPLTTKKYLNNILPAEKGNFVEKVTNKVLGTHNGFWQYTIGQRKGIGLAAPEALYVLGTSPESNTVYVGYKEQLDIKEFDINKIQWCYPNKNIDFEALVKIRYNMPAVKAKITKCENSWNIRFSEPVSGLTPGQACVIYDITDGHLLGGDFI
ncbi:MAG: tRNA 2-thiouridine(34) synthase MnmA [Cyanobacteria bacterium SIG31]|nr:tRNA 2-thiouridine(34) synthase MnmA [Cyanobacteria bacterium SIG31]